MTQHRDILDLILTASDRSPAPNASEILDRLFQDLCEEPPSRAAAETESMIWSVWTAHENPQAAEEMARALRMMSAGSYEVAERVLDGLIQSFPDWAEAWNKRATLYFLMDRDEDSAGDIAATLRLEPRHFGALSGFAQICLRRGDDAGALIAFEEALRIHPGLDGVRSAIKDLSGKFGTALN
ncbi:MAG: tetratricopeptide repeat protein [Alphaproteobacteria bacterium]